MGANHRHGGQPRAGGGSIPDLTTSDPFFAMFKRLMFAWLLCAAAFSASASGQSVASTPTTRTPVAVKPQQPHLIESGAYTNRAGTRVHRPAHTDTGAVPAGASAQCRDGSYSFSQSRRGTCSHHGGVARWL